MNKPIQIQRRQTVVSCLFSAAVTISANAGDFNWAFPVDGLWSDTANWSEGSLPGRLNGATLGLVGQYEVYFTFHELVHSVSILNPDASLHIQKSAELEIINSIENHGTVFISSPSTQSEALLKFSNSESLFGTGSLILGATDAELQIAENRVLTHGPDHRIDGVGTIRGDMINHGTLQSSLGGTLEVFESDIEQSATGVARSMNPNSILKINGRSIEGGRVETHNGGMIVLNRGNLLSLQVHDHFLLGIDNYSYMSNIHLTDADITIIDTREDSSLYLDNNFNFDGVGNIFLRLSDSRSYIELAQNLVLPENYKVSGFGRIGTVNFLNQSSIISDHTGKDLKISGLVVNQGLLGAENGGKLVLDGTYDNEIGKIFASGAGSIIQTDYNRGIFINGGTLLTTDGGMVLNNGNLYLTNTILLCKIHSRPTSEVVIYGPAYHSQQILIDNASLQFGSLAYLYGPGIVTLQGKDAFLEPNGFTNGPEHYIEGEGTIGDYGAVLFNGGVISANIPNGTLQLNGRRTENYSRIESINGSTLLINTLIEQSSTASINSVGKESAVDIVGTGSFRPPFSIDGGILNSTQGGIFRVLANSSINDVTLNANIEIADSRTLTISGNSQINGTLVAGSADGIGATIEILDAEILDSPGTIRLLSSIESSRIIGGSDKSPLMIGANMLIEGDGEITGPGICDGTLSPGIGLGFLSFLNYLELTQQSTLQIDISSSSSDLLEIGSTCQLDGEIKVQFVDGFKPTAPWSRNVIISDEIIVGSIRLCIPKSSVGLVSRHYSDGNTLRVGQSYLADFTLDGVIGIDDINAFLSEYTSGNFTADLNNDSALDFLDIAVFMQAFRDEAE